MPALRYVLGCVLGFAAFAPRIAIAQDAAPSDLDRARALFDEALRDEQEGHADVALTKFQRVAEVRDTAQVEYRVATCLEALGRRREAVKAFERATRLGRGDAQVQDVVDAANDRIAKLAGAMGKIDLDLRGAHVDAATVRIDGVVVGREELRAPLLLDAGPHALDVESPEAKPAHMTVSIVAGVRSTVSLELTPLSAGTGAPAADSRTRVHVGIALIGVGAASAVATGLALFFRHDAIATIESDCPNNTCPVSRHDEIEGLRSTANMLAPLAAVFAGVAIAGVGVGAALVILGPSKGSATPTAWIAPSPNGLRVGGSF